MAEFLTIPEEEPVNAAERESFVEHLELSHYISVFNSSAGRVRYVVFVIVVFSVAMLLAQWNTVPESWVSKRYDNWRRLSGVVATMPGPAADARVYRELGPRVQSRAELNRVIEEYGRQRIERVYFAEVPGLGVHFDVNDLGLFSGIALILLLTLLLFCVMRESENLYLALFKVRQLYLRTMGKGRGESAANFLYHALAMGQVFSSPPTLAKWNVRGVRRATHLLVFAVPALVQAYIVGQNVRTLGVVKAYGLTGSVMVPQYLLLIAVIALCACVALYEHAANDRWRSAFYFINPEHRHLSQPSSRWWLGRPGKRIADSLQRHLAAQLIEQLTVSSPPPNWNDEVPHEHAISDAGITHHDIVAMVETLKALAAKQADDCANPEWVRVEVLSSTLTGKMWEVRTKWFAHCASAPEPAAGVGSPPA
jgi:hypothetical protein